MKIIKKHYRGKTYRKLYKVLIKINQKDSSLFSRNKKLYLLKDQKICLLKRGSLEEFELLEKNTVVDSIGGSYLESLSIEEIMDTISWWIETEIVEFKRRFCFNIALNRKGNGDIAFLLSIKPINNGRK